MAAKTTTRRHGYRITLNSDGSAMLEDVRCKNFEAAKRLADQWARDAEDQQHEQREGAES